MCHDDLVYHRTFEMSKKSQMQYFCKSLQNIPTRSFYISLKIETIHCLDKNNVKMRLIMGYSCRSGPELPGAAVPDPVAHSGSDAGATVPDPVSQPPLAPPDSQAQKGCSQFDWEQPFVKCTIV